MPQQPAKVAETNEIVRWPNHYLPDYPEQRREKYSKNQVQKAVEVCTSMVDKGHVVSSEIYESVLANIAEGVETFLW
jgi:ADP-glucose pyrophosphorylase